MISHTWEHGGTRFTGNSDLSGDIEIVDIATGERLAVPGYDILKFVAGRVRLWKRWVRMKFSALIAPSYALGKALR